MASRPHIVILGGGFAGLETAFYLRAKLGDRARLTLVSDRPDFLFKPNTIYIPFGANPASLRIPLAPPAAKRDIGLVSGRVEDLDSDARRVRAGGEELAYDFLVVATGADMRPEEIPGLSDHAETIWTPAQMLSLGKRLLDVSARAEEGLESSILFTVPPGNKCAGPLYEIVLMMETWFRRRRVRDRVRFVWRTYEESYIQAFGPKLHEIVADEFSERGIDGQVGARIASVSAGEAALRGREDRGVRRPRRLSAIRRRGRATVGCPLTSAGSSSPRRAPAESSARTASTRLVTPAISP